METVACVLATFGIYHERERLLRVANWIDRQAMEGTPGGECDRGDDGLMEYFTFSAVYASDVNQKMHDMSSLGWIVNTFLVRDGSYVVLMERCRDQGT